MLFVLTALFAAAPLPVPLRVDAPAVHADDSWRYKNTVELQGRFSETHDESSVVRTEGDALLLRTRQVDSTLQPVEVLVGSDWARFRSVDGREQVINRPFAFPLTTGKTWRVDYAEGNPTRQHASEHVTITYRVVGPERVTVAAGAFDAVKVEAIGTWAAAIAPALNGEITTRADAQGAAVTNRIDRQLPGLTTGRLYKAFWYVPAVRRAVKVVEEYYSATGVRSESRVAELESFHLSE